MILAVVLVWQVALAACVPLLTRRLGRDAGYPLAAGFLATAGLLLVALPVILADETVTVDWRWLPSLDVSAALRMDALALVFALLVLGVGALIMAYCPRYLGRQESHTRTYLLLTLFATAMLGLVLANDLLVLFVFWELTSVLSFVLIGQGRPAAGPPAVRALLVTSGGGLALLVAVVILTLDLGTSDLGRILAEPQRLDGGPAWAAGALVLVAAFTKSAQAPFHFWLPGAMVAITPVSAYLHAATMVKAGVYLLMRFSALFGGHPGWDLTLLTVGLLTAVLGAFLALRQYDLKALLAYSTVSQLGLIVGVVGVGTPASDAAAILYTVAHALFKATLFMLVGIIDHEAGSRDIRELSGLHRVMPSTALFTALAAATMAGLPPTIGFVGKEAIFEALVEAHHVPWSGQLAAGLGVLAAVLTFAYAARLVHGVFTGPLRQPGLRAPRRSFVAPAAVAAILAAVLGPSVTLLSPVVQRAANDARPQGEPPYLAFWHGFTVALGLSALTVLLGTLLFLFRARADRLLRHLPTTTPFAVRFEAGRVRLLHLGAPVARPARAAGPAAFLLRPVLAVPVLAVVAAVALGPLPPPVREATRPGDAVLLLLLVVTLAGLVTVRSALGAVGLTGTVGLVLSVWFVTAGAPDVALTLLLVEVLTTIVVMLVLRRREPRLPPRGSRRAVLAGAVLAGATGLAAAAGTAALTGRRELSAPGRYLLAEAGPTTGGSNVVNTILVEFRALDTLGESVVLAVVALGLVSLADRFTPPERGPAPAADPVLVFAHRLLAPVMLVVSGFLFVRGHEEIGGGFIGALLAGTAVGLGHLAYAGTATPLLGRLRTRPLLVAGLLLCVGVGLAALPLGRPFLSLGKAGLPGGAALPFSTSLLFDLGVYLIVLALIVAAVRRLDVPTSAAVTGERR
ncbi:hydrogen gas-evolving membrane-bound hydrogenase subunit E [Micromonospora coxensis]|uniref:Multisubunit sodium/proton antiporter, MrpA subunit /multisubunit sodium/proton antiporter, MrpB subunit n=1 Tax=Micromonospora coxensis TaxID=356852 RepID=A0A1C5HMA0_9ACTN|nr:hydrogen gas-evolving membrane-bound hydrogenase subunit E [Micromonospora coxensis]SCG47043.1 multisubunit sodium/proton antiporter, MrpA subunit /multisubunit sodium/proton antiporter, MrpB subunit [Micromonospora coxensis]